MRSQFFASVAHELRTPLNSIIPILLMILDSFKSGRTLPKERLEKLLSIVHNSTIHLQSVIEDALDIARFENNKFTINKELFDLRKVVNEVSEILNFPIEQKNLVL